jgi:hypothetical protein
MPGREVPLIVDNSTMATLVRDQDLGEGAGVRVGLQNGDVPDTGGGGYVDEGQVYDGRPGEGAHHDLQGGGVGVRGKIQGELNEINDLGGEDAGGGGSIADSHKDLGRHSGGGGNVDDGHDEDTQQRGLHGQGGQEQDLLGKGGQVSLMEGDGQETGGGGNIEDSHRNMRHY